jgi:diaminopimelate decarboxylase
MKEEDSVPAEEISWIFRKAIQSGLVREEDTALIMLDMEFLASRIARLRSCFPATTLHTLAIKANPLMRMLEFTRDLGTGVEAATTGEVTLALKAGYPPERIVFDSPVKTIPDLRFALETGIHLNVDNLSELERVEILLKKINSTSVIGIRINPQVGEGSIAESSVAGRYSKFGVPIGSRRKELKEAFLRFPWLSGIHLHVGSQGCPVELLVNGVGVLFDFALEINAQRMKNHDEPLRVFDIGGGLPVSYSDAPPPRMEDYVAALERRAPALFNTPGTGHTVKTTHPWRLITEFGRWTYTNCGWTVSRVEYVKHDPGIKTAMIHVGADLFVRECLNPKDWSHRYSVLDRHGSLKTGRDRVPYNLAGPLCFTGDILAKDVPLPVVEEGDYVVIHDTGSYTFSMWSRYNSRQIPRILGVREGKLFVVKERESMEELVGFWE